MIYYLIKQKDRAKDIGYIPNRNAQVPVRNKYGGK